MTARPSVAMPSSWAMTAAVRGWSPVIISGRMPARLRPRHGVLRFGARRIDHADQPGEHQVLFDALVRRAACSASASSGSQRAGDAERAQRLTGERFVDLQDLRAARGASAAADRRRPPRSCTASGARRARPW